MMRSALEGLKNITLLESGLTIRSALQESASEQMEALVKEILAGL